MFAGNSGPTEGSVVKEFSRACDINKDPILCVLKEFLPPSGIGALSGKYQTPNASGRLTLFPGFGQRYNKPNVPEAVAAYCTLACRLNLSPTALAFAFVRSRDFVASTIIGATTIEQLKENIDSVSLNLSRDAQHEIDAIHARYSNPAL